MCRAGQDKEVPQKKNRETFALRLHLGKSRIRIGWLSDLAIALPFGCQQPICHSAGGLRLAAQEGGRVSPSHCLGFEELLHANKPEPRN